MSWRMEINKDCDKQKKIKLSNLSDEEISKLMDSMESDDELEDLDDKIEDRGYLCDEIEAEDSVMVNDSLQVMDSL